MQNYEIFLFGGYLADVISCLQRNKGLQLVLDKLLEYVFKQITPSAVGLPSTSGASFDSTLCKCYVTQGSNSDESNSNLVNTLRQANIAQESVPDNGGGMAFSMRVFKSVISKGIDRIVIMAGPEQSLPLLSELKAMKPQAEIYLIYLCETYEGVSPESRLEIERNCKKTICLDAMCCDLFDSSAQAAFQKISPAPSNTAPWRTLRASFIHPEAPAIARPEKQEGVLKVVDRYFGITSNISGDYYFSMDPLRPFTASDCGKRVSFTVVKRPNPYSLSGNRRDSNGVAENVQLIDPNEVVAAAEAPKEPSLEELKELVRGCTPRENGFVLMSEIGLRYRYKGFSNDRPVKAIFAEHSDEFEMIDKPALSVRIK